MLSQSEFENVSLKESEITDEFKTIITTYWDVAKPVLTAIMGKVKNPIVKLVVQATIWVGDGLYAKYTEVA